MCLSFHIMAFPRCYCSVAQFVQLFATAWTAACQASLFLTISQSLPRFLPIAFVMASSHLILWYHLLLFPQSFPASVLPTSIQGWFPLRLIDLISLLSKGLSGVFSSNIVRRHQFFGILPYFSSSMETQNTLNSQSNLGKENEAREIRLPYFRLYHKITAIKTVWYWHKNKHRSLEQDMNLRNKLMYIREINHWQKNQEYTMEKGWSLQ